MLNEWANISLNQEAGVCVCVGGGGRGGGCKGEQGGMWTLNLVYLIKWQRKI